MSLQYTGGALLKANFVSAGTYTTLGGVKDIKRGGRSATIVDATTQDVNDNTKRKIGALVDEGNVTFQMWVDLADSGHQALMTNVGNIGYFQLAPKNQTPAKTKTFAAVVQTVGETYPVDGGQVYDVTIDITAPVVTA